MKNVVKNFLMRRTVAFAVLFVMVMFVQLFLSVHEVRAENQRRIGGQGQVVRPGRNPATPSIETLGRNDRHFGWELGSFSISGYTDVLTDGNVPIFIRTPGDEIRLQFNLHQDINSLNGNDSLVIDNDRHGYDLRFQKRSPFRVTTDAETDTQELRNFGRGALIIEHTDWQGNSRFPHIYTDFLSAVATSRDDARYYSPEIYADFSEAFSIPNTWFYAMEEGDYSVGLSYRIRNNRTILPDQTSDYHIYFRFSVRNGETMAFPFDVVTGNELIADGVGAVTENGFRLDAARSRFLRIHVVRENVMQGAGGLTRTTRSNVPVADGTRFETEGIYTITVRNPYLQDAPPTEMTVFVLGENNALRAYASARNSGLSLDVINARLLSGDYFISSDGELAQSRIEVLPLELGTGNTLSPLSATPNGFFLDSEDFQHINITVTRETITHDEHGINKTIAETWSIGDAEGYDFNIEGVYTISASHRHTPQEMEEIRIFVVGDNRALRAYLSGRYSIESLNEMILLGAYISEDGDVILPTSEQGSHDTDAFFNGVVEHQQQDTPDTARESDIATVPAFAEANPYTSDNDGSGLFVIVIIAVVAVLVLALLVIWKRKFILDALRKNKSDDVQGRESQ